MKTVRQQASKCGGRGPVKDFLLLSVSPPTLFTVNLYSTTADL